MSGFFFRGRPGLRFIRSRIARNSSSDSLEAKFRSSLSSLSYCLRYVPSAAQPNRALIALSISGHVAPLLRSRTISINRVEVSGSLLRPLLFLGCRPRKRRISGDSERHNSSSFSGSPMSDKSFIPRGKLVVSLRESLTTLYLWPGCSRGFFYPYPQGFLFELL